MHYSKYLKTSRKPVENTPPVVETTIVEEPVQNTTEFPTVTPEDASKLLWNVETNAGEVRLNVPEEPKPALVLEYDLNDPLVKDIQNFLDVATKTDIVTKQNMRKLMKYMAECLKGELEESETMLTEEEANDIMEYMIHLNEKYFPDIPLSDTPSKMFVWNIPRELYNGMMDALNRDVPDALNPIAPLYIAFAGLPTEAIGQFYIDLDTNLRFGSENVIRKNAAEYKELLKSLEQAEEPITEETFRFEEDEEE